MGIRLVAAGSVTLASCKSTNKASDLHCGSSSPRQQQHHYCGHCFLKITQSKPIFVQAMDRPQCQGQNLVTTVMFEGAAWCASQSLAAFLV